MIILINSKNSKKKMRHLMYIFNKYNSNYNKFNNNNNKINNKNNNKKNFNLQSVLLN